MLTIADPLLCLAGHQVADQDTLSQLSQAPLHVMLKSLRGVEREPRLEL